MSLVFDLNNAVPKVNEALTKENARICNVLNEIIDFCNNTMPCNQEISDIKAIDFVWTDPDIIPKGHRVSTAKMGIRFNEKSIEIPSRLSNLKSRAIDKFGFITTRNQDSSSTRRIDSGGIFCTLKKELTSRKNFLERVLHKAPENQKAVKNHHKVFEYLTILEALKIHGQIKIAEFASMNYLSKASTSIKEALEQDYDNSHLEETILLPMENIILRHQFINGDSYTQNQVLEARHAIDKLFQQASQLISEDARIPQKARNQLLLANYFYKLKNDVNNCFPLDRKLYAKIRDSLEATGSYTSLIASATFIATAPFIFTPLAPIAAPVASISAAIATVTGLTTATSKIGRISYNALKFHAALSGGEFALMAIVGASLLSGGASIGAGIWIDIINYSVISGKVVLGVGSDISQANIPQFERIP